MKLSVSWHEVNSSTVVPHSKELKIRVGVKCLSSKSVLFHRDYDVVFSLNVYSLTSIQEGPLEF